MKLFLIALLSVGVYSAPREVYEQRYFDMRVAKHWDEKSLGLKDTINIWTNGEVPYTIDSTFTSSEIASIEAAMRLIETKVSQTCVKFIPKTSQHSDYLRFQKGLGGCYSYLGRIRGEQEVSLDNDGSGCFYKGVIIHELMHALGFQHEQNRADRDDYVTINFDNVQQNAISQFNKVSLDSNTYYSTPYDYASVMHYDEFTFTKQYPLKTIVPKQSGVDILSASQRTDANFLSPLDIQAVRARYKCNGAVVTPATTATTTTTTTTTTLAPGACTNADSSCTRFSNIYCTGNWVLNGVDFATACKQLCNQCSTTVTVAPVSSCTDAWYCTQVSNQLGVNTACGTNPTYTVNGDRVRDSCPIMCNTCGQKSINLSYTEPSLKRKEN